MENTVVQKYEPLDFCVDIHTHPTTYPFLIQGVSSPWENYDRAPLHRRMYRSSLITRADFAKMSEGRVRVFAHYLHIPERYILGRALSGPTMMAKILKMDFSRMKEILTTQPFKMLLREHQFLLEHLDEPDSDRKTVIAKNYEHLLDILKQPNQIAAILSVEGGHNLGFESLEDASFNDSMGIAIEKSEPIHEGLIDERIAFCKKNNIFFVTMNHFVYNSLATMPKAVDLTGIKQFVHNPVKSLKNVGNFRGLTYWGCLFVEKCFQNNILLDIKHCDAVSRHQIYEIAKKYNRPVVGSHIAVSGKKTNRIFHELINKKEDRSTDRTISLEFNPWDINFHDDDILAVHLSGGLLGLINDIRVLGSIRAVKEAEKTNQWVKLIYNQIKHIYKVLTENGVPPQEAFDSVCIGGDLDGMIDPINTVPTTNEYLLTHSENSKNSTKLDIQLVRYIAQDEKLFEASGLLPAEIVYKVMKSNAMKFLEKYFRD